MMKTRSQTMAERYELAEVIGRGGMGTVYRANDPVLQRTVAIKILPAAVADADPVNVVRFEREARAAAGRLTGDAVMVPTACLRAPTGIHSV